MFFDVVELSIRRSHTENRILQIEAETHNTWGRLDSTGLKGRRLQVEGAVPS